MKTRAAILVEQEKALVVDEVEVPEPSFGQVLVRIEASGICGSQIGEIDGVKGPDRFLPHLLGHEATGQVEAVGPCVSTVVPGDRVVLHWRPGTGVQAPPASYRWGSRTVNAGWVTTFQERAVVSENRVTQVPAELDAETTVLYGCAMTTAYGVVCNDAAVRVAESVLVLGTGGVGLCVVLAAQLAGAHPIIAVDTQPQKLELARRYGATHVLEANAKDLGAAVREIVGPEGVDVAVETTGIASVMQQSFELAAPQGRTILVGVPRHGERLPIDTMPLHFGKLITGSHGGDAKPGQDIPRLVRLEQSGRFDLSDMVSHRFPLEEVNSAIDEMRSGSALRCVLRMGTES